MKILLITKSKFQPGPSLWQIKQSIIHLILNFTTMKKSILILIVLAITSSTYVLGQSVHNSDPIPLTGCATGPLNPIAGTSYNYSAIVNPTGGNFQWWATTDQDFISGGSNNISTMLTTPLELVATSASYGVSSLTNNVDITWSSATLTAAETTPTFVVVQYDALTPDCSNNLKVYLIDPVNGFTVDIKNIDGTTPLPYDDPFEFCVSPIESATYVAPNIVTDYGTNVFYYEVVAANFTSSWVPTFTLPATPAGMIVTVEWDYTLAFAAPHTANNGDPVLTSVPTNNGVSIYVRVTADNNIYEGLADVPYLLTVNGVDGAGNDDVVNDDCTLVEPDDNQALQTILARPTVTAGGGLIFVTP